MSTNFMSLSLSIHIIVYVFIGEYLSPGEIYTIPWYLDACDLYVGDSSVYYMALNRYPIFVLGLYMLVITRPGKHTKSYWKWWFIVDLPIKHGDFP